MIAQQAIRRLRHLVPARPGRSGDRRHAAVPAQPVGLGAGQEQADAILEAATVESGAVTEAVVAHTARRKQIGAPAVKPL